MERWARQKPSNHLCGWVQSVSQFFLTVAPFIKYLPRGGFAGSGGFLCSGLVDMDRYLTLRWLWQFTYAQPCKALSMLLIIWKLWTLVQIYKGCIFTWPHWEFSGIPNHCRWWPGSELSSAEREGWRWGWGWSETRDTGDMCVCQMALPRGKVTSLIFGTGGWFLTSSKARIKIRPPLIAQKLGSDRRCLPPHSKS